MDKANGRFKVAASMSRSGRALRIGALIAAWLVGGATAPTVWGVAVAAARVVIATDEASRDGGRQLAQCRR